MSPCLLVQIIKRKGAAWQEKPGQKVNEFLAQICLDAFVIISGKKLTEVEAIHALCGAKAMPVARNPINGAFLF
jgi:hypothetical protein